MSTDCIENIRAHALSFRTAILATKSETTAACLKTFPEGACGDASLLLARYFEENGCGSFYYMSAKSINDEGTHAWLERDGLIVDITAAEQFDEIDNMIIRYDRSLHEHFREIRRAHVNIESYDERTQAMLRGAYKLICTHIAGKQMHKQARL